MGHGRASGSIYRRPPSGSAAFPLRNILRCKIQARNRSANNSSYLHYALGPTAYRITLQVPLQNLGKCTSITLWVQQESRGPRRVSVSFLGPRSIAASRMGEILDCITFHLRIYLTGSRIAVRAAWDAAGQSLPGASGESNPVCAFLGRR